MANVLNKITKQYLTSVNTPDYPESEWLINPVLPSCDQKFWVIKGDTVLEMTQEKKDAYLYLRESTVYLIDSKQLLTNQDGADYEIDPNVIINPTMPNVDLKYTKVVDGKVVEMDLAEQDVVDLVETILEKQIMIRQQCTAYILAAYPEPIQRSASMGIYSSSTIDVMKIFITGCIAEENRCFDALETATTTEEVKLIMPKFPEV